MELKKNLFKNYHNDIIPSHDVTVSVGMAIRSHNNINQIDGTITSNIWLRQWWTDETLKWDQSKNNISSIIVQTNPEHERSVWIPDLYVYNTAEKPMDELTYSHATVTSNGNVFWSRPGMIRTSCVFDLANFPFDTQVCSYKLGSWVYDASKINLELMKNRPIDLTQYQNNQEWTITNIDSHIENKYYNCCIVPYQSAIFYVTLKRKPGYYVLNIIIPTFATSTLMLICLLIPWDSGERISYAVTVMLSIIVFLLMLSENLPKTDTKPILSKMLVGLVLFALFIVYSTVFIGLMHDYSKKNNKLAGWLLAILDKYNLSCKKMIGTDSDSIESGESGESEFELNKRDCDKLAIYIERIFTSIFIAVFTIYCAVIFSQTPS
tara:strand:+ start:1344 stop:2480 length:1137 start_codon:yes stop_codon:yes gene_type:complete